MRMIFAEQFYSTSVSEYGTVFDAREGIIADNYILGNKFLKLILSQKIGKKFIRILLMGWYRTA